MPMFTASISRGFAGITDINFERTESPKGASVILDGVPLTTLQRGLVISLPVELDPRTAKIGALSQRDLQFSLLFWDVIELPQNNIIGLDGGELENTLRSAGVFRRSKVRFDGKWTAPECLVHAHTLVMRELNAESPGRWSLARGEKSIAIPREQTEEGGGLSVELRRLIPMPDGTAPIDDLLTFRLKRWPEALALREHLDNVCAAIVNSPNPSLAQTVEFDTFDRSLTDYLKVAKESNIKFILGTVIGNIAIDKAIAGAIAIGTGVSWNMPLVTACGVVGGSFGVLSGASIKDFKRPSSPFEYVTKYSDELRWNN